MNTVPNESAASRFNRDLAQIPVAVAQGDPADGTWNGLNNDNRKARTFDLQSAERKVRRYAGGSPSSGDDGIGSGSGFRTITSTDQTIAYDPSDEKFTNGQLNNLVSSPEGEFFFVEIADFDNSKTYEFVNGTFAMSKALIGTAATGDFASIAEDFVGSYTIIYGLNNEEHPTFDQFLIENGEAFFKGYNNAGLQELLTQYNAYGLEADIAPGMLVLAPVLETCEMIVLDDFPEVV